MSQSSRELHELNDIFAEYSAEPLVSASRSTEAFANEVYDITDNLGHRYFMKILQAQLPEMVAIEARMQQRLLAAGICAPEYLEIQPGNYVGVHADTQFTISKYIPGVSPKIVTPELIYSLGATLARLHKSLTEIVLPPSSMQWLNLDRVVHDLAGYDGSLKASLQQLVGAGKAIFDLGLPSAVIHGDLWLSNVFAENGQVTTVFDLETAEQTVRIVDLARTYTSLRFNSDATAAKVIDELFAGYDSAAHQPLTYDERSDFGLAIKYVAGACATWHAVHGSRYAEPYIELGSEYLS